MSNVNNNNNQDKKEYNYFQTYKGNNYEENGPSYVLNFGVRKDKNNINANYEPFMSLTKFVNKTKDESVFVSLTKFRLCEMLNAIKLIKQRLISKHTISVISKDKGNGYSIVMEMDNNENLFIDINTVENNTIKQTLTFSYTNKFTYTLDAGEKLLENIGIYELESAITNSLMFATSCFNVMNVVPIVNHNQNSSMVNSPSRVSRTTVTTDNAVNNRTTSRQESTTKQVVNTAQVTDKDIDDVFNI